MLRTAVFEIDQKDTAGSFVNMSTKKKELMSSAMKRTSEWISSQEISSDVTVHVGEVCFTLHKFPLVSKCGYIKKLLAGSLETDLSVISVLDIPGGAESFELAAKFCYGINFEISSENIAILRCAAEFLEMTEDYSVGNLVQRTEAYLTEVSLKSLPGAVSVLHSSENLIPMAEKVKLVSRCIDAIAYIAWKESQILRGNDSVQSKPIVDWWAEDLTVLRVDVFQRVLVAMMGRGLKQFALGPVLMLYAQKSLRGLELLGNGRKKIEARQEHEKRVVLETIVSLLPREKNALSVSFLSMLLRASIYLETTIACRLDLEKRMALQLGQAVLDDLLIPSYSYIDDTSFDVDTVQRILINYLEQELDEFVSPCASDMERVGKLMENYVAEIASDKKLSVSRIISLAELIPEQSRPTEDGMYRAIDIYLKAHPNISDVERKKVCSLMDCQKLSREACAHAAQNDRLPVQTVVQVLYYEQQRLRDVLDGSDSSPAPLSKSFNRLPTSLPTTDHHHFLTVPDQLSVLKKENEDLKLELVKIKIKMKEMERNNNNNNNSSSSVSASQVSSSASADKPPLPKTSTMNSSQVSSSISADKPPLPKKSIMSSVSKKLGRLYPFGLAPLNSRTRVKPPKDRRHSIS